MAIFTFHPQEILIGALILAVICLYTIQAKIKTQRNKGNEPPEADAAWPVIGHLHLLGASELLHKKLGPMADKYGPIFRVRLGIRQAIVISNWEVAKQCFTTNDKVFSTRPKSVAVKHMSYNYAMPGFAPYGRYWQEMRKLITSHLLSVPRLELLKKIRDEESNLFIRELHQDCEENNGPVMVQMSEKLGDLSMNIITRKVAGKRYSSVDTELRRCQRVLLDFFQMLGTFYISDAVPLLGWLDVVKGNIGKMKSTARELDCILSSWVAEHRKKLNENNQGTDKDFMDVMLSVLDDGNSKDTIIKATCLSLIAGANDTSTATLTWALSMLLNNRHVLKKAQGELDRKIGRQRQVKESDVKTLTYLHAIVKETLRLFPAAPLLPAREAIDDCTVSGFYVPKGTQLLLNLWKLHRDPTIWEKPLEFIPERFLEEKASVDLRGQNFEFLPFGSGRRMCPGVSFALHVIHLTLARLLHAFELGTVSDMPVDISECPGFIMQKATPLEVILTPRLPATIYIHQET